eukprot:3479348-Alexandrium_andersonii.AAC.1
MLMPKAVIAVVCSKPIMAAVSSAPCVGAGWMRLAALSVIATCRSGRRSAFVPIGVGALRSQVSRYRLPVTVRTGGVPISSSRA